MSAEPGELAAHRLSPDVCSAMREAIAAADGNEVFFLVRRGDEEGSLFDAVKVVARGHKEAVPAVIRQAGEWEVAIHNHPSGALTPSDADLAVASVLARNGVGCAIVDNPVERIYVVVEPVTERPRQALDLDEVDALLGPDGPIALAHGSYEDRPGQRAMARSIAAALNDDAVLAVEAGTGTGKSLAYLVPALLWAVRNDEKVVVSTHTMLLQRQLIEKDIPFVIAALGLEARAVLVTGRGNYACKRRVAEAAKADASFFEDEEEQKLVAELVTWAQSSGRGHREELSVPPTARSWERIASATDKSLKSQCPYFSECFYYRSRRAADKAHLLIVNHHLLLSDLAIKVARGKFDEGSVLPAYGRLILDEAHHLEDIAARHLGGQVARRGIAQLLGRLRGASGKNGLLPFALTRLVKEKLVEPARELEERLLPDLDREQLMVEMAFDRVREILLRDELLRGTKIIDFGEPRPWPEVFGEVQGAAERLDILGKSVINFANKLSHIGADWTAAGLELSAVGHRLQGTATNLRVLVGKDQPHLTRWVELAPVRRDKRGHEHADIKLVSSPLDIAELLAEHLFANIKTAVLTSATLAVEGGFDFLARRVGLPDDRTSTKLVRSPFDYPKNCALGLPTDYPRPGDPRFEGWLPRAVLVAARASRGRMFVLFTSHRLLRQTADAVRGALQREGCELLVQGERSRQELLRRFRASGAPVLFGTDSFWEGVDMPGTQLVQVVIPRLPFRVPDHPVEAGRLRAIRDRGGDAFREYSVPCAVLKLKQGFGRLIRSRRDRGAVVILDPRVRTRWYGESFLTSLPDPTELRDGLAALLERLRHEYFDGVEV